jgi:hypothetical protein
MESATPRATPPAATAAAWARNLRRERKRLDADFLKMIDEWRRKQDDVPTRPEAIRRLVELGLKAKQPKT